ncbi:hypothetical protein GIB67_022161 [Kingdonia uniflora]|uniref:Uncharacterized protein n=1 Tax=Kingdonia uniflora TaxID=39325 RepID=A0A7J7N8X9_9MAGN|nr:hypothetical protein GIB67_022161 [Kingdonia uniflora]
MTGVNEEKRQISGEEARAKTHGMGSSAQPNLTTNKIAQKFLKRQIKMALPASGTTVSGEVAQGKRRKVEPLGNSREKFIEGQSALMDDLKEVEEWARLVILHGKEDASQMVVRLVKGIWLGTEEQESELKKAKNELEKNLAQAKTDALKEVKQLKAAHAMAIEEEEAEVLRVVDGLDGVSPQSVLDNQGDDVELPEGGNEKVVSDLTHQVEEKDSGIKKRFEDLSEVAERVENLQRQVDALAVKALPAKNMEFQEMQRRCDDLNERVAQLKAKRDQAIAPARKAEARERSGGSKTLIKAPLVQRDVGEIRAKDFLVKRKDELLKDLPARKELNVELGVLLARVVELQTINLAESAQYIAKLKDDAIYHDRVDADIIAWKDTCTSLKVCLDRLKARFAKEVAPDVARSALLSVIVAYFIEEVKRLELERDTLLKTLSD